jgi:putative cell wall-binding protein
MSFTRIRARMLTVLTCVALLVVGLAGLAVAPANAGQVSRSRLAAIVSHRAATAPLATRLLTARNARGPIPTQPSTEIPHASTLPWMSTSNGSSVETVLIDRAPGTDLTYQRGGSWVTVPDSGRGFRVIGYAGPTSIVWQTPGAVHRYDTGTHVRVTRAISDDAFLLGNTDDGWLIGEDITSTGGSITHVAVGGSVLSTTAVGNFLVLNSISDGAGALYLRVNLDNFNSDVQYLSFGSGTATTVYSPPSDRAAGFDLSLTPTNLGWSSLGDNDTTAYRRVRTLAQAATPLVLPSNVDQVVVSDTGFAWTLANFDSEGFSLGITGLRYTVGGPSIGVGLPGGSGILSARKNDFVITAKNGTPAVEVRSFASPATGTTALPALPTPGSPDVTRQSGGDRYSAAAAISAANFSPNVSKVYIATGLTFPDALAGAPVAAKNNAPILLVPGSLIPPVVATELTRLSPASIVVLGGPGSVTDSVKTQLAAYADGGAGAVSRYSGVDRYAAAAAISAGNYAPGVDRVFVATGGNFPDALSGAPVAGATDTPILLVPPGNVIPQVVKNELVRLDPDKIVVLGGPGSVSTSVQTQLGAYDNDTNTPASAVQRLSGTDRYSASASIVSEYFEPGDISTLYVATGATFPDALAGAPVAGIAGSAIVLVASDDFGIPFEVQDAIERLEVDNIVILGGAGSVSDDVKIDLGALLPAPDINSCRSSQRC